ncbi:MAG: hypothetical protein M5U34_45770 [Chloroflexi bacterium]|nr:hypothetical protein [Chloroflexota bacterium]
MKVAVGLLGWLLALLVAVGTAVLAFWLGRGVMVTNLLAAVAVTG